MPQYKDLSKEKIESWLVELHNVLKDLKTYPTDSSFKMFFLKLYEYLFVSVAFEAKYNFNRQNSVKLTISDITHSSSESLKSFLPALVRLKSFADSIRHDSISIDFPLTAQSIFEDKKLMSGLWKKYLKRDIFIYSFLTEGWKNILKEIYFSDSLKSVVEKNISQLLQPNPETGFSRCSIFETVSIVSTECHCSETFVKAILVKFIKNEYVII